MAQVGTIFHSVTKNINTNATNAYVLAQSAAVGFYDTTGPDTASTRVMGRLGSLYLVVDTIAGGCTSLTVRICTDATGDTTILNDVTLLLSLGITSAAKGTAIASPNYPYAAAQSGAVVFWKTNAGTCNVRAVTLNWNE